MSDDKKNTNLKKIVWILIFSFSYNFAVYRKFIRFRPISRDLEIIFMALAYDRIHSFEFAAFELAYNSALCLIVIGAPPPVDSRWERSYTHTIIPITDPTVSNREVFSARGPHIRISSPIQFLKVAPNLSIRLSLLFLITRLYGFKCTAVLL